MQGSSDECAREVLEVVPLIMRTIRAQMRSHRAPDLSVPQFRTLTFLNRRPGASLSDVADHVGFTLPSMSKLVDGLVARGLVERRTDPADRRRITLELTPSGGVTLQAARQATQAYLISRLQSLPEVDRLTIIQAMRALYPIFASDRVSETEPAR